MRDTVRFVGLAFAISWLVWFAGLREKWATEYLVFGSAGPAVAAIFLSRRSLTGSLDALRRGVVSIGVMLLGWLVLLMSRQPFEWNFRLLPPSLMPALVCWAVLRSRVSTGWRWPLISLFTWPVFLLIPAALFHLAGGRVVMPRGAGLVTACVMFAKQFLFAAVLEEPGWRGYLLPRLEERFSPLVASVLVWLPWAAWHAPLDFTGGVGASWVGYLQVRVAYFLTISILMTWLYNRSGRSLLTVALFHAGFNTFPFVLPYAPPMLILIFPCTVGVIVLDRMWRRKDA